MNLPTDLMYTPENSGKGGRSKYVKNIEKELCEVRKQVAPFNQAASQLLANPFRGGDLILIYQQQMEKTHKLSPRWRGQFKIIKTPNSFQVVYDDQEKEKITHVSNCKKFQERLVGVGDEAPPPGDAIPKQKKPVNQMNSQNVPSSGNKMTLCHFEVRVRGMTHAFDGPSRFLLWLQGEEDTSANICVQGVRARGEAGSQEVTDFFFKDLRMAPLPGRWQRRTLRYLRNRCGHRFLENGVDCKAWEKISFVREERESRCESLGIRADVASFVCNGT